MSRRTDLIQQLVRSDKFGDEKDNEQKFLAATAELILTDLINIATNGIQNKGAGSLIINLCNDSTVFMSGADVEVDLLSAESAEDEDVVAVPRAALDADGLVRHAELLELARRDHDAVLREQRDARLVVTPDDVLEGARHVQLGHRLPLLHVEERDALLRP